MYLHLRKICSANSNNKDGKWQVRCPDQSVFSFLDVTYDSILQESKICQISGAKHETMLQRQ